MKHWLAMALTLLMTLTVGVAQAEEWVCKYDSAINNSNYCGICGKSRQESMVTPTPSPTPTPTPAPTPQFDVRSKLTPTLIVRLVDSSDNWIKDYASLDAIYRGDLEPGQKIQFALKLQNKTGSDFPCKVTCVCDGVPYAWDEFWVMHHSAKYPTLFPVDLTAGTHTIEWYMNGYRADVPSSVTIHSSSSPTAETPEKYFSFTTQDRLVIGGSSQKVMITGYNGSATDIVIPKTIQGKPVVGIGASAFYGSSITSIVIPEGVTGIMFCAFADCHNLQSISLPSTIISGGFIGDEAFSDCYRLKDVYYAGSRSARPSFSDCGLDDATWHYQ